MSTLKEPYRLEGKKTMGLELAEQTGWRLPDVILYPTGGGTGLIGMWKAFQELRELGWLQDGPAAAADQLPERRLRPDRASVSRRASASPSRSRTPTPWPAACACRRRSAIS